VSGEVVAERFEVERLAGQGGMGTVFRALDRTTKGVVALKIVEGANANARFAREAQVLAVLDHPSIVRYVAHGPLPQGRMYLAMEWLEGAPLDERLDRGTLSLDEALAIGRTLAGALGAAHAVGVVHRDMKPSNVLLRGGEATRAVLVDFGIAHASKATVAMTKTGAVIGTPAYMAPEQARGDKGVDARADVFSLGCVLFECLCGRPAFVGEHVVAVLAKILLEPAPRLSSLRPDLPRALDDLVARMLAKEPADRPADGDAVARALEALDTTSTSRGEAGISLAPRSAALGSTERRFATVLLASPPAPKAIEHADTADALLGITQEAVVFDVGSTQGVTITPLANGMFVGAVVAEEGARDAAERVARCALALAERAPDVTVSIASGRAVVVADQVPVGDVIDRAARLLALRRGQRAVVVDEPTRSIVEAAFVVSGDAEPWTVVREREASERGRTVLGRVVPFVGRDRELALLEASFRECAEEPVARASLVIAAPGTGKSRLAREVTTRIVENDALAARPAVWTALAQPATQRTPFGLASDLLRRALGIAEGEPIARRREKLRARVNDVVSASAAPAVVRFLAELVGASSDTDDPIMRAARRAPEIMRARIEETVITFVMAELARRPLLVVAEDIHWADAASVNLLGLLLARAKELPLMVLALARPSVDEVHPNVWRDVRCERIVLAPLLKKASEKIARAVLGDHPEIDAIVQRAEGNALFVEELARACAEGRAASDLPPTVVAATEARLAAMEPDMRQILRAAAVFGERFWASGITHLLGGAPFVAERLERLERLELVSRALESRFAGERELVFRHALVRDAAYAMFTEEDRALGHALAGEWLQGRVEDAALLAYHFENGGRATEAAHHHAQAAEQAMLAQDVDAVHRHAARAEALGAAPPDLATARAAQADASLWVGAHPAAAEQSRLAMADLERASARWFEALAVGLVSSGKLGDRQLFESFVTELESTRATQADAGRARAVARARAAIQLAYFNEIPRADALLEGCEAEEPGAAGDIGVKAWLLAAVCERGTAAGEPVHPSVPREARLLCESIGDTRGAFGHWGSELQLFATIGAFAEATECGEQMLAASGGKARSIVLYARSNHVMLAGMAGDFGPLTAFIEELRASASPRLLEYFSATCAQLFFFHGRLDDAENYARQVLVSLPLDARVGPLVTAHAVLARVEAKRGNGAAALEHVEKLGQQAFVPTVVASATAMIFLARAEALEAAGRAEEAREALASGVAHMERCSRNLRDYRVVFYRAFEGPDLFTRAKGAGLPVPEGALLIE